MMIEIITGNNTKQAIIVSKKLIIAKITKPAENSWFFFIQAMRG